MKKIRQATDIIGVLERGDLNADLTAEITKVLAALQEAAPPKGKTVKGEVSLKLKFAMEGSSVRVESEFSSKTPKRPRGADFYFVTEDAALSTEHPKQTNMFDGPREVHAAE